jgi:hypothetical protein
MFEENTFDTELKSVANRLVSKINHHYIVSIEALYGFMKNFIDDEIYNLHELTDKKVDCGKSGNLITIQFEVHNGDYKQNIFVKGFESINNIYPEWSPETHGYILAWTE